MSARVRGMDLGVTPDEPEPEEYEHGQIVVWNTAAGPIDMVFLGQDDDGWVELVSETGQTGVVVSEREVSPQ
ncbi:hypothetical protein Lesp02_70470 [Lentzea sp. NBRC 105346]|uniref:hypothetical protein n=1 Tax=Lentzea sp. NBRC 105346 TaxID=3032205 RepID=UPI0024A5A45D|nr:hypothetical protein [Lentzea sp. NBRC 105346]GLZ34860.1 hypothetical protein Lesp02_70470 [Lentzea sp. NBRC 105346]